MTNSAPILILHPSWVNQIVIAPKKTLFTANDESIVKINGNSQNSIEKIDYPKESSLLFLKGRNF